MRFTQNEGLPQIHAILKLRQESLNSAILPTKNRYFIMQKKSILQKKTHPPNRYAVLLSNHNIDIL